MKKTKSLIVKLWPKTLWQWVRALFVLGVLGAISLAILIMALVSYFGSRVPDLKALEDYAPKEISKVYAEDGTLLAEYARERRVFTPYEEIPQTLINAFLAAEDKDFYKHGGFDLKGIIRAAVINVLTNRTQGASTITQQVAKNFLLTSEQTYVRKIKELILARKIEERFSKQEIITLYLNQIYFGNGAYGIAAAADGYFSKPLDELTIPQFALLAGLPKAPSAYNPVRNPTVARLRRDVVIRRMETEKLITKEQADDAIASDLNIRPRRLLSGDLAPHFTEYVRRQLVDKMGEEGLYEGGVQVYTTLDVTLQEAAQAAVIRGLREYDRRHGFRGPIGRLTVMQGWQNRLEKELDQWQYGAFGQPAAVLDVTDEQAVIGLADGSDAIIPLELVKWARKFINVNERGAAVASVADALSVGDIVVVKPLTEIDDFKEGGYKSLRDRADLHKLYSLEQHPKVQAAMVVLDVETGGIKAMVGGTDAGTGFNRAVQAVRQPGSSFKPIVYAHALDHGYTPASIILDAPVVFENENGSRWKPQNYSEKVYGPTPLRIGVEQSRNLMTIRLAEEIGMGQILDTARKFGIESHLERDLSTALGGSGVTPLELTNAYRVFPNGGYNSPAFAIEKIVEPKPALEPEKIDLGTLKVDGEEIAVSAVTVDLNNALEQQPVQQKAADPHADQTQVVSAGTAFQMTSIMEGVVQRGTGWRLRTLGAPVAGKTGTTNDYVDAWFVGYTDKLAIGVWVGFDQPQSLGDAETGSKTAAPIWQWFAEKALRKYPAHPFAAPADIRFIKIDAATGTRPTSSTEETILEAFKPGEEPNGSGFFSDLFGGSNNNNGGSKSGIVAPPIDEMGYY